MILLVSPRKTPADVFKLQDGQSWNGRIAPRFVRGQEVDDARIALVVHANTPDETWAEGLRVVKRDADNAYDGHSGSAGVRHLPSMVTQYSRPAIPIVDANIRAVKTTCLAWSLMQRLLPRSHTRLYL